MAKKKAIAKKQNAVKKTATPEDIDSLTRLFSEAFFETMTALTRAEPVEAAFAKFAPAAQQRTKAEHRRLADLAGRYVAEHAGPNPTMLTQEASETLTVEALQFALDSRGDEE